MQRRILESKEAGTKRYRWLALILIAFFSLTLFAGCGGGDEEGEGGEESSTEEASAPPPPARPAPAARPPRAPRAPRGGRRGSKKTEEAAAPTMIKKKLPDDRLIDFEFDPTSIGKDQELETRYQGGRNRRNTFRDIKFSMALRNEADVALRKAKELVEQVSNLPEGARNEVVLKKAKENLKKGEGALKSNNYLKAKELAELASKLAYDAMRPDEDKEGNADVTAEWKYKGSYQDNTSRIAIITRIDPLSKREKLYMKKAGDVLVDSNSVDPNTKQPLSYRVVDIFEDYIVILDIVKNKRSNLILNNDYKKELGKNITESQEGSGGKSPAAAPKAAPKSSSGGNKSGVSKSGKR